MLAQRNPLATGPVRGALARLACQVKWAARARNVARQSRSTRAARRSRLHRWLARAVEEGAPENEEGGARPPSASATKADGESDGESDGENKNNRAVTHKIIGPQ